MAPTITAPDRLNLGGGDLRIDGFATVDLRPECADVVCDVTNLHLWEDGSVAEIVALDLLEHFPAARTAAILAEWRRVLRPGGTLRIKVPNLLWLSRALVAYDEARHHTAVDAIIRNIYGGHRWGEDGCLDAHHTGWTPATILATLVDAGFDVIEADAEPNMTITAARR